MPSNQGATQVVSALPGNAVLIWIREDGSEFRFPIIAPVTTIGRDATNMVPVNDNTVSRFHAKLVYQNGQYTLLDLGSANKTFVNGQAIKETLMRSSCDVKFGGARFKFQELQTASSAHAAPSDQATTRPSAPPAMAAPRPSPSHVPTPYPAAPVAAAPVKTGKKPKLLFILGGVFVFLILIIIVVSRLGSHSNSRPSGTDTAKGKSDVTSAPAPAPPADASTMAPPITTATPTTGQPVVSAGGTAPAASGPLPSPPGAPSTSTVQGTTPSAVTTPAPPKPQTPAQLLGEAASLETSGKLREARIRYEQVLKLDPTNSQARSHVESLRRVIQDAVELHFKNAKMAYDYLRYDEAVDEWNLVLALAEPTDPRYAESQRGVQQAQARLKR